MKLLSWASLYGHLLFVHLVFKQNRLSSLLWPKAAGNILKVHYRCSPGLLLALFIFFP